MSHSYPGMYGTALQNWKSAHSQLALAIQTYVNNCTVLERALTIPPQLLSTRRMQNLAFVELAAELPCLPAYENSLLESRLTLNKLRNTSRTLVPINSLPPEILDIIFSLATKRSSNKGRIISTGPDPACPAHISSVCRLWRQKAPELPSLWTRATLWAELSRDYPLQIEVEEEEDDPKIYLTYTISHVVEFLTPLMRRVDTLSIKSECRSEELFHSLVNCWAQHGTSGTAKILELSGHDEEDTLALPGTPPRILGGPISLDEFTDFFRSLESLSLINVAIPGGSGVYSGLVGLHVGFRTSNHLRLTQSEIAGILAAAPRLRSLIMSDLVIREGHGLVPDPVVLNDLEILALYTSEMEPLLLVYPLISRGSATISIGLKLFSDPQFLIDTRSFLTRLKVTSLVVDGCATCWVQDISAVLAPLPHLKILAIQGCDLADPPIRDLVHQYLVGDQSPDFWPAMRQLHIIDCRTNQETIQQLLDIHTPQSLHLHLRGKCEWEGWDKEEMRHELEKAVSQTGMEVVWVSVPRWGYPDSWKIVEYLFQLAAFE